MAITPLPPAPQVTDDPASFNTKAFAWVDAIDSWTSDVNSLAIEVDADATAADTAKLDAQAAAASAVAAAGATKWVSGTSYAEGAVVWSPINYLSYRRKTAGSGTTDPSLDSTNWAQVAGTGDVTTDATQTLTNKTLTSPAINTPTITGTKETRVAMAASDIDLSAGNYFTKTISGATTLTVSNTASSGSVSAFILDLTNGGAYAVTFFAGVTWAGGTAPTLTETGRDILGFFTHDGGTTWNGLVLGLDMQA
jgi:hypothetical protein